VGPLREPLFRALWIAAIASNVGGFMEDVGEAWLMTSLTTSTLLVALVEMSKRGFLQLAVESQCMPQPGEPHTFMHHR